MAYTSATLALALDIWEFAVAALVSSLITGRDLLANVLLGGPALLAGSSLAIGLLARVVVFGQTTLGRPRDRRDRVSQSRATGSS